MITNIKGRGRGRPRGSSRGTGTGRGQPIVDPNIVNKNLIGIENDFKIYNTSEAVYAYIEVIFAHRKFCLRSHGLTNNLHP